MNTSVSDLRAACLLDGIDLLEQIGEGGSSIVWRAKWRERDVAVKVLDPTHPGPPGRSLAHPSILDVLGKGRALGHPYVILERFPTDLGRILGGQPLRRDLLRPVLMPLLDAVEFAHQRGVVHGDIKPANVLVDTTAVPVRVALTDFGHSRPEARTELELSIMSTERGELSSGLSTLPYLAPERLAGQPASLLADVYAMGVLLFEVLTGRLPLGLELPSELAPDVDPRCDGLVKKAMAREPSERLQAIGSMRRELLRFLSRDVARQEARPRSCSGMIRIPGSFVVIGDRDDPGARPMHEVKLDTYWIDATPVTNRAFLRYVCATGAGRPSTWPRRGRLPARYLDLPATGVSWLEARAYAEWVGKRLPTEYEWERAAQGPEHRRFPYGEELDISRINPNPRKLAAVGSYPSGSSSEGVHDLTGNGWEWTGSCYRPNYENDPPASHDGSPRVIRGGVDPARDRSGSATFRAGLRPDSRDPAVSFRCARDA